MVSLVYIYEVSIRNFVKGIRWKLYDLILSHFQVVAKTWSKTTINPKREIALSSNVGYKVAFIC